MGVMQIIFVLETNDKTKSDDRYIKKLIEKIYDLSKNDIKFQYVHMGSKYKYNKSNVLRKINSFIQINKDGENHVVYCFDTDRIDNCQEQVTALQTYENFCVQEGFHFVWFCYDIEMVFLGHSVPDDMKEKESKKFSQKDLKMNEKFINRLSRKNDESKLIRCSNVLTVLSSIFEVEIQE